MERKFSNRQSKENAGAARYLKVVIITSHGVVYFHLTGDFMTHTYTSRTCMFEAESFFVCRFKLNNWLSRANVFFLKK